MATVYDPTPVTNLTVTRSSTTGAIYPVVGGVREGINVKFGGVSCGPYSTQYDISWATAITGATASRSATETTFDAPLPVDLDKVPNGAAGEVTVTASCPTSTKPAAANPYSYTQPLPTPVLTATAGTPPNVHTLSWGAVTSLAAQYSTELSRDGGAFTLDGAVSPNPTAGTTETVTYPLGSTYGVTMAGRITATVGPTSSSPSQPKTILTPWPAIIPPALTPVSVGLLLNVTSEAAVCPAGTHPEFSQTRDLNGAGTEPQSPWSTNPVMQYTLSEGDQAVVTGTEHCVYTGNQPSPASTPVTLTFVQPITSIPNPPKITFVDNPTDGNPINVTYPVPTPTNCPVNTTLQYRTQYSINGGVTTAWSSWAAASTKPIAGVHQGDQLVLSVAARCVSPYTQGPSNPTTKNPPWVRPIPAPAAPAAGHDAGGVSAAKDDRFTYSAVACPVDTTPAYIRDWFVAGVGAGNDPIWVKTLNLTVATNWGFDYNYTVHARCESPYAVSGSSPAASTSWQTPIPAPGGTPTLNLSTNSVRVNTNFSVFLTGASCQPNLQLRWNVAPTGGQVSGSFTTHLTTTGWHTYNAAAFCHSPYTGRNGPAASAPPRGINVTAPVAGYTGGPTAYNVQSGCPWPQGYTPQQNVGFRLNASNGSCYYQSQQPMRDLYGNIIVGQWYAWSPADPGQWYANNTYTG